MCSFEHHSHKKKGCLVSPSFHHSIPDDSVNGTDMNGSGFFLAAKLLSVILDALKEKELYSAISFFAKKKCWRNYFDLLCRHQEIRLKVVVKCYSLLKVHLVFDQVKLIILHIETGSKVNMKEDILSLCSNFVTSFLEVSQVLRSLKESIQKDEQRHQQKKLSLSMLIPTSKRLFHILLSLRQHPVHKRKVFTLDPEFERKIDSLVSNISVAAERWKQVDVTKNVEQLLQHIHEMTKYCFILSPQPREDKKYFAHLIGSCYPYDFQVADISRLSSAELCFFCFKRLKVNSKENHLEDESWPHISKKREAALILIGIANSKHFF